MLSTITYIHYLAYETILWQCFIAVPYVSLKVLIMAVDLNIDNPQAAITLLVIEVKCCRVRATYHRHP